MATLPRSTDDLILDGIVSKIAAHRDDDVLISSAFAYDIDRDRTTPWQDLARPLVNIEEESDTPDRPTQYTVRIRAVLFVPTLDDDKTAASRLYALKEQVRRALLDRDGYDLGLPVGTIADFKRPTWAPIAFDDAALSETILAGAWSFEICYPYEPADVSGPALSEISIDLVGRFSALYPIGGQS